jgi:hypothetical protein
VLIGVEKKRKKDMKELREVIGIKRKEIMEEFEKLIRNLD